tara:strand:+ start:1583 stop:1813 length:231 start_codon:yes stop_codon:yes gene_type:complete
MKEDINISELEKTLNIRKFNKYKENLMLIDNDVYSYTTHVATVKPFELLQWQNWSQTTQKHINYVAKELGLKLIRS